MAPETARLAVSQGYTNVHLYAQGLKGWEKRKYPLASVERIPDLPVDYLPAAKVMVMLREDPSAVLLDIREDSLFGAARFDVPGVLHVPCIDLLERMDTIPMDSKLVLACEVGTLSPRIASYFKGKGYHVAGVVNGGMEEWRAAGLPVRQP